MSFLQKQEYLEPPMAAPDSDATAIPDRKNIVVKTNDQSLPFAVALSETESFGAEAIWRPAPPQSVAVTNEDGELVIDLGFDFQIKHRLRMNLSIWERETLRLNLPKYRDGIRITIRPSEDGQLDGIIELTPLDERLQVLLEALVNMHSDDALKALSWATESMYCIEAREFLAQKYDDPWAAVVGAVLLANTSQAGKVLEWMDNLSRILPSVSDVYIASAWACASQQDLSRGEIEAAVLGRLGKAIHVGAPTFQASSSLAQQLLDSLSLTATETETRTAARRYLEEFSQRFSSRAYPGPYLVWVAQDAFHEAQFLEEDGYSVIASGMLSKTGFRCYG